MASLVSVRQKADRTQGRQKLTLLNETTNEKRCKMFYEFYEYIRN